VDLTDKQWEVIAPLLPAPKMRKDKRGRPWRDPRDVMNGILWILRTGAPWGDLPDRYPPRATCHRRFQKWVEEGTMRKVRAALLKDLDKRGKIDWDESFVDGSFASAKKGGALSARPSGVKAPSGWQSSTAMVFLSELPSTARRPRSARSSKKR
jgi:transposase